MDDELVSNDSPNSNHNSKLNTNLKLKPNSNSNHKSIIVSMELASSSSPPSSTVVPDLEIFVSNKEFQELRYLTIGSLHVKIICTDVKDRREG